MATTQQDTWIARVLSVQRDGAVDTAPRSLGEAAADWRAASEMVDGQIAALQKALLASDDEELQEIGQYGVNGITGNFKVKLMAALMGVEAGRDADRAKLAALVPQFRAHLDSSERIAACDDNPFGVTVSIRATLGPALDRLARSLGA
jgi:hypothetical protein